MSKLSFPIHRTAKEHQIALEKKEYTAQELASACLQQAEKHKKLGAFLRCDKEKILEQAKTSDKRRAQGQTLSRLDGIPISIKDNICQKDSLVTCASRILENFVSPYNASVIDKLETAGAVVFGRTNMDEFAMGSSTENSAFQKTHNPWNEKYVPGGSSGGAAASVASCITPLALGSDTGGSIRQPAAFCGTIGLRPSYGRVSRYGLVAFASSLDQIGPLSRSVEDSAILLSILIGHDPRDTTSHPQADQGKKDLTISKLRARDLQKRKIGLILPKTEEMQDEVSRACQKAADWFAAQGSQIIHLQPQLEESIIPIYYILATAEASSNLGRYDGVRYGKRSESSNSLRELYIRSRTEGFGAEVRRRILLGTFVLSSGYYDAYYKKAQLARQLIQKEYIGFFQKVDVILSPSSPCTAFAFGARNDPLAMYRSDLFTISASLAGVPCLNIPVGLDNNGLPIGLQMTAPFFAEQELLTIAASLEEGVPELRLDYSRF